MNKLIYPDQDAPGETITIEIEDNRMVSFEPSSGKVVCCSIDELEQILEWAKAVQGVE